MSAGIWVYSYIQSSGSNGRDEDKNAYRYYGLQQEFIQIVKSLLKKCKAVLVRIWIGMIGYVKQ